MALVSDAGLDVSGTGLSLAATARAVPTQERWLNDLLDALGSRSRRRRRIRHHPTITIARVAGWHAELAVHRWHDGTEAGLSYIEDVARNEGEDFTPTQALLASVLEVALLDFARPGDDPRIRQNRNSAQRWLFGAPLAGNGLDFDHVCDVLNLQPEVVRRLALAGRTRLFPVGDRQARRGPIGSGTPSATIPASPTTPRPAE